MRTPYALSAGAVALVLLLAACSTDDSDGTEPSNPVAEAPDETTDETTDAPPEETTPASEGGATVPVGGTFSSGGNGEFDFTYQGLLDLGTADGGSKGEITCLGIMVSATMTSLGDVYEEGGYLLPATRVIDAGGTDISAVQTLGCPQQPYLDAGWTPVVGASFPREGIGTPVDQVLLGVVGVPVGEVGDAEAITFRTLTGEAALEFAVTETL